MSAATRAAEGFLAKQVRVAALGAAGAVALLLVVYGVAFARHSPAASIGTLGWTLVAALIGAVVTTVAGYLSAQVGLRATLRSLRAAELGLDHAVAVALRAAGLGAMVAEALSAAAVAGLLGLLFLLGGGAAAGEPAAVKDLLDRAICVLPGLAAGSVGAAAAFALSGATYHVVIRAAGDAAGLAEPGDPRSPSMVADLVGHHAGLSARRTVQSVACFTLASVALVVVGASQFRELVGTLGTRAWALVTLPILCRGVGLVATGFGISTARVEEAERASLGLWRGHATATALVAGGAAGAAMWLVGAPFWPWFAGAGALGSSTAFGVAHAARYRVERRLPPVQEVLESLRTSPALGATRALGRGLGGLALPVSAAAACLLIAAHMGQRSGLAGGAWLGVATAAGAALASGSYVLALGLFGPAARGALAVASLASESERADTRRRATLLEDAGFEGGAVSDALFGLLGAGAVLLVAVAVPTFQEPRPAAPLHPVALASGLLGAVVVLALSGRFMDAGARSARSAVIEAERQLRSFPRDNGVAVIPEGYTPSYRALIDLAGRLSTEGAALATFGAFAVPSVLGIGLRLLYRSPDLAVESMTAFVVVAAVTCLVVALFTDGARTVLDGAYRASRTRGPNAPDGASPGGLSLGAFLGDLCAPATYLFASAAAAAALLIAPMLARL